MLLMDKLSDRLQLIYTQLQIPFEPVRDTKLREMLEYYENDRERYIELYDPQLPRHLHLSGEGGIFGKSIPIAQRTAASSIRQRGKDLLSTKTHTLVLFVVKDDVLIIEADSTVEVTPKRRLLRSATYSVHTEISPEDISPDYQIKPPSQIRPLATSTECLMQKLLSCVFTKFGPYIEPDIVYHKTECALETVQYLKDQTVTIDGKDATGKLLQIACMSGMLSQPMLDCSHNYFRDLFVFITQRDFRLVLRTDHIYKYFRRVPVDEDISEGFICEPTSEKREREYHYTDIEDIEYDDFIPSFY